jgi:hypothetical protein
MQTRFKYPTRKISDVVRALCTGPPPPRLVFIILSTLAITITYKKESGASVPPIDLDLAQVLPFGVPTVLF